MKYTGNYFPFIIISLLLYGLFFYFHDSSPLQANIPLNSGKQAIQMQLITEPTSSAANSATSTTSSNTDQTSVQDDQERKAKTAQQIEQELATQAVAEHKEKISQQKKAQQLAAKKQHRESITQHKATNDALLKEQIFNDRLAAIEAAAAAKRAKQKAIEDAAKKAVQQAEKTDSAESSIASILPISEVPLETTKSPAKIIPKTPQVKPVEPQPKVTAKPKITRKTPINKTPQATPTKVKQIPAVPITPVVEDSTPKVKRTFKPKVNSIEAPELETPTSEPSTKTQTPPVNKQSTQAESETPTDKKAEQPVATETTPVESVEQPVTPEAVPEQQSDQAVAEPNTDDTTDATEPTPETSTDASSNDQEQSANNQGELQKAVVASGKKPDYPRRAVLRQQQGRVLVKMTVLDNGKTKDPEIIKSSGYSILDNEVLAFVRRELFIPAMQNQKKMVTEQLFSYRFVLN